MKIIISCSNGKNGDLFQYKGESINFVSHPDIVEPGNGLNFHPDDLIPNENRTWRELVEKQEFGEEVLTAHQLYRHPRYNELFERYGNDLFIFSAGWGIVRADYKLPKYNITFSSQNTPIYARRMYNDLQNHFKDFNQLQRVDEKEELIFIAGSDYVIPFCKLTEHLGNKKIIVSRNGRFEEHPYFLNNINNFSLLPYQTKTSTNWHYEYAKLLMEGEVQL